MKMLERMSGIDVRTIPMNDPETMSIFSGVDALCIDTSKIQRKQEQPDFQNMGHHLYVEF